jgi:signal transduction histidine kinase
MSNNAKAAQLIKEKYNEILSEWENRVTSQISASSQAPKLALRDHMPNMLDDIADLIANHRDVHSIDNDDRYEEIIISSGDHGRHRAATTHYSIEQIIKEYIIFHRVLTEFLQAHSTYSREINEILKYTIETIILRSATSFSESMQEMQEKLLAMLAHDMRNPLGIAANCLELLEPNQEIAEFEHLKKIALRSINKAVSLTEELLNTISVQSGEGLMLSFSKGDYVEEVTTVYQEAKDVYNQKFELECPYEKLEGILDGAALRRVLENLLTNAIKYGDRNEPITISLKDLGDSVEISVKNLGNPISKAKQHSIFSFLTKEKNTHSTNLHSWGIGLTLVKLVTQAHRGKVEVESSKQNGTVFTITIGKQPGEEGKVRTILNSEKTLSEN